MYGAGVRTADEGVATGADTDPRNANDGRRIPALEGFDLRVIEASAPERFAIELATPAETYNAAGAVHGGVLATLIDHVGGRAAGHLADRVGPTADLHIRYLNPASGDFVRAEARILRAGGRLVIVAIEVTDPDGRVVATGDMTVAVSTRPGSGFPD
jgi:uncharacterized protein (TIGR00369 family)